MSKKRVAISGGVDNIKTTISQTVAIAQLLELQERAQMAMADRSFAPPVAPHPQISLWFREDKEKIPSTRNYPHQGKISFRLMDETYKTITEANLKTLGLKIREKFGTDPGYVWDKGKDVATYNDWNNGYRFKLLVPTEAEGKKLVTDVLALRQDEPNWGMFTYIKNGSPDTRYPSQPPTELIVGESRQLPQLRPRVEVRFSYAEADIYGLNELVCIYDRTGLQPNPLVDDRTESP